MDFHPPAASDDPPRRRPLRQALRYLAVAPIVGGVTLVAEVFFRLTGSDRLSSIFLAGVLISAFLLGSGPAYVAAGLAFLIYLFQVNPRFQFSFGSPDDFNVLMLFLVVSGLIGLLTGRARDEAARANSRQRVTKALLDATQEFSASADEDFIRRRLALHVARAAHGEAAVIGPDGSTWSAPDGTPSPQALAALRGGGDASVWRARRLQAGETDLGAVAWQAPRLSDEERTMLDILIDTGAAAILRSRLAAQKTEAETRAHTEDLRNALLSSVSHDLRTPLAAILASASSLQEFSDSFDAETRRDLATTIREEAERLDHAVADLLSMTRLEAGALNLRQAAFNVPEVVRRAVKRRGGRNILFVIDPALPEAFGDPLLFEQALGNVVENARRYAPADAAVAISAAPEGDFVRVEVRDEGPGLADGEAQKIFDRFYRGGSSANIAGTGLGLSITKRLMEAMDGSVAAANRTDASHGLVVTLRLRAAS